MRQKGVVYFFVTLLLLAFFLLIRNAWSEKGFTFDEVVHLISGLHYWEKNDDFRVGTGSFHLVQKWAAFPSKNLDLSFPPDSFLEKVKFHAFTYARTFIAKNTEQIYAVLASGRFMMSLIGVLAGLLVFLWSRSLWGNSGGLCSLLFFVFSSPMLAYVSLVNTDFATAFLLFASTGIYWRLMTRLSLLNAVLCGVVVGCLVTVKLSGLIFGVVAVVLLICRIAITKPLEASLMGRKFVLTRFYQRLLGCGLASGVALVVCYLMIWGLFSFRYSAVPEEIEFEGDSPLQWETVLSNDDIYVTIGKYMREHKLLPELYIYDFSCLKLYAGKRVAYFAGDYGVEGRWQYFPFAFLVKSPFAFILILFFALISVRSIWGIFKENHASEESAGRWQIVYQITPLLVLIVIYSYFAITSPLNIGLRHFIPVYLPIFVILGFLGIWFCGTKLMPKIVLGVLSLLLVVETLFAHPHHLGYFNLIVGRDNGYRFLVDSSHDWGEDLPALEKWLLEEGVDELASKHGNVYLSYFGTDMFRNKNISLERLHSFSPSFSTDSIQRLKGGVYIISPTMLMSVYNRHAYGRWREQYESQLKGYYNWLNNVDLPPDGSGDVAFMKSNPAFNLMEFEQLQFGRLCAYLRYREIDHRIGHGFLIYYLSDSEVWEALHGEPKEMETEIPKGMVIPGA